MLFVALEGVGRRSWLKDPATMSRRDCKIDRAMSFLGMFVYTVKVTITFNVFPGIFSFVDATI